MGVEFVQTAWGGGFNFRPIEIRPANGTLSQSISFVGPTRIDRTVSEFGGFVQDRWVINPSLTVDGGFRLDRNAISLRSELSPRLSLLYLPSKNGLTTVRAGVGLFYDRSILANKFFDPENLDDDDEEVDTGTLAVQHTSFPARIVTSYEADGRTILDGPREFKNVTRNPWRDAHSIRWSLQVDRQLAQHLTLRLGYVHRVTKDEAVIVPKFSHLDSGLLVLKSRGTSRYNEFQVLALYSRRRFQNWTISYVWSHAEGSLNTADNFLGDMPALVVRPNQYGTLPFDIPHRVLAYGEIKAPHGVTLMPAYEIRYGFPYSSVNYRLAF